MASLNVLQLHLLRDVSELQFTALNIWTMICNTRALKILSSPTTFM